MAIRRLDLGDLGGLPGDDLPAAVAQDQPSRNTRAICRVAAAPTNREKYHRLRFFMTSVTPPRAMEIWKIEVAIPISRPASAARVASARATSRFASSALAAAVISFFSFS